MPVSGEHTEERKFWRLRILGTAWLVFGVLGACAAIVDLIRNFAVGAPDSAMASDFIALGFCLAAAFAGFGVFRQWHWARLFCGIVSFLLFLYAMAFLLMVGLNFGIFAFVLICAAVAFSAYSIIAIVRYTYCQ